MKKFITTVLIVPALFLSGCGGKDETNNNQSKEPVTYTPTGTPAVEAADPLVQLLTENMNSQTKTNSNNTEYQLEKDEFLAKAEELNGVIVDLRSPEEIEIIPMLTENTINIDYYDFENFGPQMAKLDKTKPYFIYCAHANRSSYVYADMKRAGFETVYELVPGVNQ